MKYIDEFRVPRAIRVLTEAIQKESPKDGAVFMEVCGTHTQSFRRFGLHKTLPPGLKLVAGPGCPVCVSSVEYIEKAILYARMPRVILASYGDMLRVPGVSSTLEKERGSGARVRVVYSATEALEVARGNPGYTVIFLAVGFETTAPTVALTVRAAAKEKIGNLYFFSSLKLIPPVMRFLLERRDSRINGFLCPGHVSSIIGIKPYAFIPKSYKIGCCVAGFEPHDMLQGILSLLKQLKERVYSVDNQYARVVKEEGNLRAQRIIADVFESVPAHWRGLGMIEASGLALCRRFARFDAERQIPLKAGALKKSVQSVSACRCQEVLAGRIEPFQCPLFGKACTPGHPLGPCMISSEGACNAYFRYR